MARLNDYQKLMKFHDELTKMSSCVNVLSYDSQVSMPSNGSDYRGELMEMLSIKIAKSMKSKEFLTLLDKIYNDNRYQGDERVIVNDMFDDVKFSNRIPVKLHGQSAKMLAKCNSEWEK